MSPRNTITDVARVAGVSVATVDRVLNRRPGVRSATVTRVETAVAQLGYRPDAFASRLARGVTHRFAFILPTGTNTFMDVLGVQLERIAPAFAPQRAELSLHRVDVFDAGVLAAAIEHIGQQHDGLAVVALDHPQVRAAIDDVVASGKPVITLISDAPASKRAQFVGIDNSAAGRTAGTLLGRFLGERRGKIATVIGSPALRDHAERLFGFNQVLCSEYPGLTVLPPQEGRDDKVRIRDLMDEALARHPDIVGIYNVGAGLPGIATALEAAGRQRDVVFIGHELTDHSRRFLLSGVMHAVINQDPGHEVRSAVRHLLALSGGEPILPDQERIRIDIFVRDNLP